MMMQFCEFPHTRLLLGHIRETRSKPNSISPVTFVQSLQALVYSLSRNSFLSSNENYLCNYFRELDRPMAEYILMFETLLLLRQRIDKFFARDGVM